MQAVHYPQKHWEIWTLEDESTHICRKRVTHSPLWIPESSELLETLIGWFPLFCSHARNNFWKKKGKDLPTKLVFKEVPAAPSEHGDVKTQYRSTTQEDGCNTAYEYTQGSTAFRLEHPTLRQARNVRYILCWCRVQRRHSSCEKSLRTKEEDAVQESLGLTSIRCIWNASSYTS